MNEVFKKVLLLAGVPLVLALLFMFGTGDSAIVSLVIIILVPAAYAFATLVTFVMGHRTWAKVFLLSMGIVLLVGFSVCTLMMSNTNFH